MAQRKKKKPAKRKSSSAPKKPVKKGTSKRPKKPPAKRKSSKPPPPPPPIDPAHQAAYEKHKARARQRNSEMARAGRDIGELPAVVDPERKERAREDLGFFCKTYFPRSFALAWSPDHLKAIERIQQATLAGGLFAYAMPRGSGKTTLAEAACTWAALYGHQPFVLLIGSDAGHALGLIDSIKVELETNELLLEDFPEVCYPIERLEGIANRCKGQLYQGERTQIGWTARQIVLPTIAGSPASGVVLRAAGITGRLRGMRHKRADGTSVRPRLVVIDDPQTDASARSVTQCQKREGIIAGAVLGLAGPGQKIAAIMPCTVIQRGDVADALLDRERHPDWNGERTKLIYALPEHGELWDKYADLRAESLRRGNRGVEATAFYAKHRKAMDAGARPAWPERYNPDEISAVQHAMNLKLQLGDAAFSAEYQNEPKDVEQAGRKEITAELLATKLNRLERGEVPAAAHHLTAFVDVHARLLYWKVVGWDQEFGGYLVDYGTWPEQPQEYFALRDVRRSLELATGVDGLEGALYAALEKCIDQGLLARTWQRDDGAELKIERLLIDANWGQARDVVYLFCRQSAYTQIVMPSHGKGIGASGSPISNWKKTKGDRVGAEWRVPHVQGKREVRHVIFDANHWKTFVAERLTVPMGARGCLSVFGSEPARHRLLVEHLTSEYPVRAEAVHSGRAVDEWKLKPARDNHWWDCLVGSAVAASMGGIALLAAAAAPQPRKRLKLSELQAQRRRGR